MKGFISSPQVLMLYTLGHACPNPNDSIRSVTKSARIPFYCWPSFENVATTTTSLYVDGRGFFFFWLNFRIRNMGSVVFMVKSAIDYQYSITIQRLITCCWNSITKIYVLRNCANAPESGMQIWGQWVVSFDPAAEHLLPAVETPAIAVVGQAVQSLVPKRSSGGHSVLC